MSQQLSLDYGTARTAGEQAARFCMEKAVRTDSEFPAKARAAILKHLQVVGEASGEELTQVARAHGAVPHDDRAFGPVFGGLSRAKLIRTVGFCMRARGHGTAGGRIWALVSGAI